MPPFDKNGPPGGSGTTRGAAWIALEGSVLPMMDGVREKWDGTVRHGNGRAYGGSR